MTASLGYGRVSTQRDGALRGEDLLRWEPMRIYLPGPVVHHG
jgi:hypothetical protein